MTKIGRAKSAETGGDHVEFLAADICAAPHPSAGFDAIVALNLLHLVDDVPGALKEIRARLKPGRLFLAKTVCLSESRLPWSFSLMREAMPVMQWLGKARRVTYLGAAEMDRLVAAAGLDIIETGNHPAQPPSRFIVARKVEAG